MTDLNDDTTTGPVGEVAWDDDSIKSTDIAFFKGEKAHKHRIFVMSPKPMFARVHYEGGYFLCKSTFEIKDGNTVCTKTAKCCKMLGQGPKLRFSVVVAVFDTKKDGTIKTKNPEELDFEFQVWTFGEDKFQSLRTKHEEWDLTQHDLLITCNDEQYQKIEIDVMKSTLTLNKQLKPRVDAGWAACTFKDTQKFLGRNLSEAEVIVKCGGEAEAGATTSNTGGEVAGQSLEDVLTELKDESASTKSGDQPATVAELPVSGTEELDG